MSPVRTRRRQRRVAAFVFLGSLLACSVLLAVNAWRSELSPSSAWGIGYGIAAAVLLAALAAFGARRRLPRLVSRWRLGSAASWLRWHLYGGVLFFVLMVMHSAFRMPQGALTTWLWWLSLATTLSGLLGLGLQRWVPRMLASGLSVEVLYERIPELVEGLRERAEALAEGATEPIRALYARDLAPVLSAPRHRFSYYLDVTGGRSRLREFDHLRELLEPAERERLAELEQLYRTKLEIDAHYTLQRPLRLWLLLHVPVASVLVVLTIVHVVTVWLY